MKTIYVDKESFICFMEQDGTRLEIKTSVFDGMSDREIEDCRFIPEGYRWSDPDSGENYTGQHVMPIYHNLGGTLHRIQDRLFGHDDALLKANAANAEHSEALNDIYAALTELASLIG